MPGRKPTHSAKREQVALLLALGRSARKAAAEAGVGERSVRRWLTEDTAFAARVNRLRAELFERTTARLGAAMGRAARRLHQLLKSEDERVALAASRSVLGMSKALRETVVVEQRLEAVEQTLAARGKPA
jgi:hypothetical protein